jgi:hypothetical protein
LGLERSRVPGWPAIVDLNDVCERDIADAPTRAGPRLDLDGSPWRASR